MEGFNRKYISYASYAYLERVLSAEQVDDLEAVLHNPDSHQLLACQLELQFKQVSKHVSCQGNWVV